MGPRMSGARAKGSLVCWCRCDGASGGMGGADGRAGRDRCRRRRKAFASTFILTVIGSSKRFRQEWQNAGESTQPFLFNFTPFDRIVVYQVRVGYGNLLDGC